MLELGEEEERFHREVTQPIRDFGISHVWLFGPRMKSLFNELQAHAQFSKALLHFAHFDRIEDLSASLQSRITPGARILVKGSRGMKMERVLDALIPGRKPS
jgi:UDP-N-acetylmuramoyl-tripeptide--D-alanyl-D-alanine ligase